LDALRGIAAFLVAMRHIPPSVTSIIPNYNSFLAVDFFFCLSGFVIAYSYEKRLLDRIRFRDFLTVRVIRLYPLAIFGNVLGILYILMRHGWSQSPHTHFLMACFSSLLILPNLFAIKPLTIFPFNPPVWSLFYEMVANLFYAAAVRCRVAKTYVLSIVVFLSFTSLFYYAITTSNMDQGLILSAIPVALARVFYSFFVGVLLFRLYKAASSPRLEGSIAIIGAIAITGLLLAAMMVSTPLTRSAIFQLAAVVILFPAIVLAGSAIRLPASINRICALLGDMSYPLYVLHAPFLFGSRVLFERTAFARTYGVPLYVLVLSVLAWAIGKYCDVPLRKRLTSRYKAYQSGVLMSSVR
jgi:peptidoglycan/LPS O-acetylase OafA/YrhL